MIFGLKLPPTGLRRCLSADKLENVGPVGGLATPSLYLSMELVPNADGNFFNPFLSLHVAGAEGRRLFIRPIVLAFQLVSITHIYPLDNRNYFRLNAIPRFFSNPYYTRRSIV